MEFERRVIVDDGSTNIAFSTISSYLSFSENSVLLQNYTGAGPRQVVPSSLDVAFIDFAVSGKAFSSRLIRQCILISRIINGYRIYREYGIRIFIQRLYRQFIRQHLPRAEEIHNGVSVNTARLFDRHLPFVESGRPEYESGLVKALNARVSLGDDVVIVGGGLGVTATVTASLVGKSGSVIVYEGSEKRIPKIRDTARRNDVEEIVSVNHAVVGEEIHLDGPLGDAKRVHPAELPDCDILELDCEGAERLILDELEIRPPTLIVECHEIYNSPVGLIKRKLIQMGYEILFIEIADKGLREKCIENGIYVIVGARK